MEKIPQIVNYLTDNDLYTFTVMNYIIHQYPNAEVKYQFFDRNKHKYPQGFAELLQEQVNGMKNVVITKEEIAFMKSKCYYLPEWFYTLLEGYRFDPSEVKISQDEEGYLSIGIEGKWWRTVLWEMPILSTVSELSHIMNGDMEMIDTAVEYARAFDKAKMLLENGVRFSDMSTRRRLSFTHQDNIIKATKDCATSSVFEGEFLGTSNVYFAMKYNLTPIGTMSHQIICFEECVSGVHECNFNVMQKWSEVYEGNLGIMLYDAFGDDVFFDNINTKYAKLFDGLRVDSGDNMEQLKKIITMYNQLKINPKTKSVVFSNALNGKTAIELHREAKDYVNDSAGIGTWLGCSFEETEHAPALPIKHMNIVIKLIGMRYNNKRKWLDCIKLSSDKGKVLGNPAKVKRIQEELGII